VSPSVSIPERFNGPLDSGNGGYCSGVVASFVDGQAEVSLRSPVPLETPLEVAAAADDGSVRVLDGETVVAEARPAAELDLEVPARVSVDAARAAMGRYRGLDTGPFRRCFVCGRARDDAFGVFAGRVEGRDVVASTWTPPAWAADGRGEVRPELVWAALDCPTYFATYLDDDLALSFLVRFAARIECPVIAGREHVVIAWPIESSGRKRRAGSAVVTPAGETLAVADALLVEPRA
jgi:hypothetical protein